MAVTSTQLLDAIKRGCSVPSNQERFNDASLLKFADEEIESIIVPMITSLRQEFFVVIKNVTIVALQSNYKIPYRAVGRTLRDVKLARTTDNTYIKNLSYIQIEDSVDFQPAFYGEPWAYTIISDNLVLLPTPTSANFNIQFYYELKPSYLVGTSAAGLVTGFDTTTGIVTLNSAVTGFSTGMMMDIVDGAAGCTLKAIDIVNTNISSNTVTFAPTDLPSTLAVNDWVCISQQSPVLNLPDEFNQVVAQAVICRILEALSDFQGLQIAKATLDKKYAAAQMIVTPRVESQEPVVYHRNSLVTQRTPLNRSRYYIP